MRTAIVVPVFNHWEMTAACLDALVADPELCDVSIVIVDDASVDGTASRLRERFGDRITVVHHGVNQGFATSCNDGAAAASAVGQFEHFVFLNNDTIPRPGWYGALRRYREANTAAGIIGCRLLYPDGRVQHAGVVFNRLGLPYHLYQGLPGEHPAVLRSRRLQAVTAACMLVDRDLFERLGGFDTAFLNAFEDVDLCLRAGQLGVETRYCHESVVVHLECATRGFDQPGMEANVAEFRRRWGGTVSGDDLETVGEDGMVGIIGRDAFRIVTDPSLTVHRVAMVGTFDVENYGDVMFPLLAQHELCCRLGTVELHAFGFTGRARTDWPYEVRPVEALLREISTFDLLLVGGGDLIRFDEYAPGYAPTGDTIDPQTGLWLQPILLAGAAGVPIALNAPGVLGAPPTWSRPLLGTAFDAVDHMVARDHPAAALLSGATGAEVAVVPDTAFGLASWMGASLRAGDDWQRLCAEFNIGKRPFIVAQMHRFVDTLLNRVLVDDLFADFDILCVPVGPVLGDGRTALTLPHGVKVVDRFLHPRDLAVLIARSRAVVALSLHAAITALAAGVPVIRPGDYRIPKYSALDGFDAVLTYTEADLPTPSAVRAHFDAWTAADRARIDARAAAVAMHWDVVGALAKSHRAGAYRPRPALPRLIAGMVERQRTDHQLRERLSAAETAARERNELQRRLALTEQACADQERQLALTEQACADQQRQLALTEQACADQQRRLALTEQACADQQRQLALTEQACADQQRQLAHLAATHREVLASVAASTSWRITAPMRAIARHVLHRPRGGLP